MKQCPTCKSVIDAKSECPICYTTITYEDEIASAFEQYKWNRYVIIYFIKRMWISVLCCIIGIVKIIGFSIELKELLLYAILFALASLCISIFQRRLAKKSQWKYTEDYAEQRLIMYKYLYAVLSIFLFVIL